MHVRLAACIVSTTSGKSSHSFPLFSHRRYCSNERCARMRVARLSLNRILCHAPWPARECVECWETGLSSFHTLSRTVWPARGCVEWGESRKVRKTYGVVSGRWRRSWCGVRLYFVIIYGYTQFFKLSFTSYSFILGTAQNWFFWSWHFRKKTSKELLIWPISFVAECYSKKVSYYLITRQTLWSVRIFFLEIRKTSFWKKNNFLFYV